MAHPDEDGPGRASQPAQPRAFRGDSPRGCPYPGHSGRPAHAGRLPARHGRTTRGRHRPRPGGKLLRAFPLERQLRREPRRQCRHQRRRRPDLTSARLQNMRSLPIACTRRMTTRAHGKEASAETNTSIEMRNLAVIYLQLKQSAFSILGYASRTCNTWIAFGEPLQRAPPAPIPPATTSRPGPPSQRSAGLADAPCGTTTSAVRSGAVLVA